MMSAQPDAGELLGATLPHLVPERVVEVASMQAGCPVAAYVLDVDGSFALRLAGDVERFPERIRAPVGVGPEIIPGALPQLRGLVTDRVGPSTLWPMVLRARVMGFLLARDREAVDLEAFAGHAACALALGSWDADRYRLRWINCGHPTPLILRADGPVDELNGERTYPLGVRFTERVFPVLSAQVGPGDRLLLYSDGVTERRTTDGGRIGENGLRGILRELGPRSAATTVRGLQDAVINASPDALRDDATMLVIAPQD